MKRIKVAVALTILNLYSFSTSAQDAIVFERKSGFGITLGGGKLFNIKASAKSEQTVS